MLQHISKLALDIRTIQGFLRRQSGQQFALGRAVPVAEQRAETAAGVALQMLDQLQQ